MGTVIILPELGQATTAWQDLVVGHRQKQVVDYEPLLEGAPEFEELSAQITALVRAAEQPVTLVGNGFGALVGLRVAASQSGRIDRLLLVAPDYHLTGDLTVRALPSLFTPKPVKQLLRSLNGVALAKWLTTVQCRVSVIASDRDRVARDLDLRLVDSHYVPVSLRKGLSEETLAAIEDELA